MTTLIVDLDGTLTLADTADYEKVAPNVEIIKKLKLYKAQGFTIKIFTARNMRTFKGDIQKITSITLPIIKKWLAEHKVPYDELMIGKPWCGETGFYIDDKAIRPSEFVKLSQKEIEALLNKETTCF